MARRRGFAFLTPHGGSFTLIPAVSGIFLLESAGLAKAALSRCQFSLTPLGLQLGASFSRTHNPASLLHHFCRARTPLGKAHPAHTL
jgi:hypothetical protein